MRDHESDAVSDGADVASFAAYIFRRVLDTPRPYYLLGKRYFCRTTSCAAHSPGAKSKSYMPWSQPILDQLPKDLLLSFPGMM